MGVFSLEQGEWSVRADFAFYGLLVGASAVLAGLTLPAGQVWAGAAWTAGGLFGWTLAEYALHRFVLHGLQPFKRWHALHHARPRAFIATPTVFTAALFLASVAGPALWLLPLWRASALLLGVLLGYLVYTATHHAVHHGHGRGAWLRRHQRWHALHHRIGSRACYGVSLPLWDHVFGSAQPQPQPRA